MGQPLITQGIINDVKFGFPSIKEQAEIAQYILSIDKKIENLYNKKQTLTTLFKTLLHELMTGQRRVHELEFEAFQS
jgi:type I restriction enzyme S subunit